MTAGNSSVSVSWVSDAGRPTLAIAAFDPDGIASIWVYTKFGTPVEIWSLQGCPNNVQTSNVPFPRQWFPVIVDLTDCQQPHATDRSGWYDADGNIIESEPYETDPKKNPGKFIPKQIKALVFTASPHNISTHKMQTHKD